MVPHVAVPVIRVYRRLDEGLVVDGNSRSHRDRKCDRDDAHDDESQGFSKGGAVLIPEKKEDVMGREHGEPKCEKRDAEPRSSAVLPRARQ
jgi:hypothetical protein